MRRLILLGGGGHCESVLDAVLRMQEFKDIVILDPHIPVGNEILGCKVVGDDSLLDKLYCEGYREAFITVGTVGDTAVRRKLTLLVTGHGLSFINVIDPSAIVSDHAVLGKGVFVGKKAVINAGARIGDHSIINTGAIIEHDCNIEEYVHVAVGATICGNCKLEDDVFVGAGAVVIQGVEIKRKQFIKAGAVFQDRNDYK